MKTLLLALAMIPTLAHADAYDDRVRMNQQRAEQNEVQQIIAKFAAIRADDLRNIAAFGARYGYAETPNCVDFSYSESSWRNFTRQECGSGICVNVKGEGDSLDRRPNDPMWADIVLRSSMIYTCKVLLRNGLACQISNDFDKHTYGGNCLDANGRSHSLSVPLQEAHSKRD